MLDRDFRDGHEALVASSVCPAEQEVLTVEEGESDEELADLRQPGDDHVAIPGAIKSAVHRWHVNTGHRSNLRLARALLICGA